MSLDEAVARLAQVPNAVVGRGPNHPESPDRSTEQRIRAFLDDYPVVRGDPCYVEFLEKYAGARIDDTASIQVHILGFTDISIDLTDTDEPLVTDGFLVFAHGLFDDATKPMEGYEYHFAFDVQGDRRSGVYRSYGTARTKNTPFSWYVESFCQWLDELVAKGGVYEPPPVR